MDNNVKNGVRRSDEKLYLFRFFFLSIHLSVFCYGIKLNSVTQAFGFARKKRQNRKNNKNVTEN